jgi:hypothetical protein
MHVIEEWKRLLRVTSGGRDNADVATVVHSAAPSPPLNPGKSLSKLTLDSGLSNDRGPATFERCTSQEIFGTSVFARKSRGFENADVLRQQGRNVDAAELERFADWITAVSSRADDRIHRGK